MVPLENPEHTHGNVSGTIGRTPEHTHEWFTESEWFTGDTPN